MTDRSFCHFGPFFALLSPLQLEKSKFWKNEKDTWRYYNFTHDHHKWQSYDVWLLRYGACNGQNFLSFWTSFSPFTTLTTWKVKILKKWKKNPGDIIILQKCTINDNHMMYGSWDINRQNFLSFWTIFCPFISLTTQKIKILKKMKKSIP